MIAAMRAFVSSACGLPSLLDGRRFAASLILRLDSALIVEPFITMAETTKISWCDSTWNPWIGCTKVGPGCDHCYAEALMDKRWHKVQWGAGQARKRTSAANWRQPLLWEREHEAFEQAHGRRRRVFCASLADVFDKVAKGWQQDLFALIRATPHLDWLLLTKRIGNADTMIEDSICDMEIADDPSYTPWPWPNVWLGITVVSQEEADRDIPKLLATPARVRFLSIEPMLGPVDLRQLRGFHNGAVPQTHDCLSGHSSDTPWGYVRDKRPDPFGRGRIDWVICGGESGTQARPMQEEWARSLAQQCKAAGVAFMMKQMGGTRDKRSELEDLPHDLRVREFPLA